MNDITAAKSLGWASIAIGLTEILGRRPLNRTLGISAPASLMLALGAREILSGLGILSFKRPAGVAAGLWSRVLGDGLDLALMAFAFRKTVRPNMLAGAVAMVLGITLLDILYAKRVSQTLQHDGTGQTVLKRLRNLTHA